MGSLKSDFCLIPHPIELGKYMGHIGRQRAEIEAFRQDERILIPDAMDYRQ